MVGATRGGSAKYVHGLVEYVTSLDTAELGMGGTKQDLIVLATDATT